MLSLRCALLIPLALSGCVQQAVVSSEEVQRQSAPQAETPEAMQKERDLILSLLAMTIVRADWQEKEADQQKKPAGGSSRSKRRRGHNIGSVLARNSDGMPVYWARNAAAYLDNGSQHGEVRLIQNFLDCPGIGRYADKYTVYTTLEPCAMCTGLMTLTQVHRVVYLQKDTGYGDARKKLLEDIPYPNVYLEATADTPLKAQLEERYEAFKQGGGKSITDFLLTQSAKEIYDRASKALREFKPKHHENEGVLKAALQFVDSDLTERYGSAMMQGCPVKAPL